MLRLFRLRGYTLINCFFTITRVMGSPFRIGIYQGIPTKNFSNLGPGGHFPFTLNPPKPPRSPVLEKKPPLFPKGLCRAFPFNFGNLGKKIPPRGGVPKAILGIRGGNPLGERPKNPPGKILFRGPPKNFRGKEFFSRGANMPPPQKVFFVTKGGNGRFFYKLH